LPLHRIIWVVTVFLQIYKDFNDEDALWVKQTEFKGGAPGGPPLATNHDVKAVEYLLKHKLSLLSKESGLEELMKVKEFIHFGLTSQGHPHPFI
jgi:adenylosuccinate lyase